MMKQHSFKMDKKHLAKNLTSAALLNNQGNDFFDLNVSADLINHPLWTKWRKRSPFNINTCLDCEALGICGGGCPYSAELNSGDIYEIDKTNCSFNKEALKFLLSELWNHQKTNT